MHSHTIQTGPVISRSTVEDKAQSADSPSIA